MIKVNVLLVIPTIRVYPFVYFCLFLTDEIYTVVNSCNFHGELSRRSVYMCMHVIDLLINLTLFNAQ